MRTLAAGIAVLALVAGLVFFVRGGTRGNAPQQPAEQRAVPEERADSLEAGEAPAARPTREASEATEPVADAGVVAPPEAAPAPTSTDPIVRARLVDERGAALAGGRLELMLGKDRLSAESVPGGEVTLSFPREGLTTQSRWIFEASAPGRIHRTKDVERQLLEQGPSTFLGEFVLLPGGSLAGRVVDERGAPASGARVIARPPSTEVNERERVFLPWSWFGDGIRVSGTCDASGSYSLEGVPCGAVEVLAGDYQHLVARSSVLDVRAAAETRVPELVLRTPEDADRIAGRVVLADGRPCPGLDIGLLSLDEGVSYSARDTTDAEGRFELVAARETAYTLVARDPATHREAKRKNVHAGELGIEIVFDETRRGIELAVRDEGGPVAGFRVIVENAQRRGLSAHGSSEPGLARVPELPAEAFHLSVISAQHRPQRLGPFAPESAPAHVDVVLERAGGVAGTVSSGSTPVAGAEVHAHRPVRGGDFGVLSAGFVTLVEPYVVAETRAGDDGRFFLPLRESGRYRLHASGAGGARAASGWLDYTDGAHVDLDLALPEPGTIQGRLLVASGVDARGSWIGAGDGEGHSELAQTGDDGAFRFEGLAPGHWQVRRIPPGEERDVAQSRGAWRRDESEAPEWDTVVHPGQTTVFDIDVRDELPCTLEGRLAFDGVGANGTAYLGVARASALLDADGRFTLRAARPDDDWLYIERGVTQVIVRLRLAAGPNTWELDLPAGEVQLENLPPVPPDPRMGREDWPEYALLWSRGETRWMAILQQNPSASARVDHVPAGKVELRWRGGGARPQDERNWPLLREIEVRPRELVTLRLP